MEVTKLSPFENMSGKDGGAPIHLKAKFISKSSHQSLHHHSLIGAVALCTYHIWNLGSLQAQKMKVLARLQRITDKYES